MRTEVRYGLYVATGLSAWVLAEYALGFHTISPQFGRFSGYGSIIVPLVLVFAALKERMRVYAGASPVIDGINTGFRIALLSALLFTLFMVLYNTVINPGWAQAMVDWERKRLLLNGATDDQIEQFMDRNRRINNIYGQAVIGFLGTVTLGVVITVVELTLLRWTVRRQKR